MYSVESGKYGRTAGWGLITTLINGQSHFTLDRIGGADANMSYDVIFNSVFLH